LYTLGKAAEAVGRGKPAILKAIRSGRISAKKNEHGEWDIDPAELHRVYPPIKRETLSETVSGERQETDGELVALRQVIAVLERQLMDVQSQREDWKFEREDLKAERARLLGMVENQTRLITHLSETPPETVRRSIWQRLTGKG
jgi:chromosome segregation ATPase